MRGFAKFIYKQMLKVSGFYLEKQKSFIPPKKSSHLQYQNKKGLLTDTIFSKGFGFYYTKTNKLQETYSLSLNVLKMKAAYLQ